VHGENGFRLERVYRLRTKLTEAEEVKSRRAHAAREDARGALEESTSRLSANLEGSLQKTERGCSAADLRANWAHRLRLEREKDGRQEELRTKEELARLSREELLRAKREEQILEKLRERHLLAALREEKRYQQKALDEVAGRRMVRRGGDTDEY